MEKSAIHNCIKRCPALRGVVAAATAFLGAVVIFSCATTGSQADAAYTGGNRAGDAVVSPATTGASAKPPVWTSDAGRLKLFPRDEYLSALGVGFSEEAAKKRAVAGISEHIKAQVETAAKSSYRYTEQNDGSFSEESSIGEDVLLKTDNIMYSLDYTEVWRDAGTTECYCVAFIEKEAAWKQIEPKLKKIANEVEQKFQSAEDDTTGFWRPFLLAKVDIPKAEFRKLYDFGLVVNPDGVKKYDKVEARVLEAKSLLQAEKPQNTVRLAVKNDKNGVVQRALAAEFGRLGFTVTSASARFNATAVVTVSIRETADAFVTYPGLTLEMTNTRGASVASFANTAKKTVGFEAAALEEKAYRALAASVPELFADLP